MKIITHLVRAHGKWTDVVEDPSGGYAWFYSIDGAMVCEGGGAVRWTRAVPTDFLRFTRGAAVPALGCLGQALDNTCFLVTEHAAQPDGIAYGQNPVACGLDGTPYVVRNAREYTRGPERVTMPLTSQGIRDVLPDGSVIFGDATYHGIVGGHRFWQYQTRGTITVGQAGRDVGVGVLHGSDYLVIPVPGEPLGVHQAQLADGTLAVCAWTVHGAELWILDLHAETPRPTPVPVPEPVPPEPVPMPNTMEMPQDVYDTYVAVVAKYPHIGSDDDRRAAHRKAVATVRARHGDRWITKTEHASGWAAASTDALCFIAGLGVFIHGQRAFMYIWDMIDGTTRQPMPRHASEPLREAYALIPDAHDWLAGVPAPAPTPSPTPAPPAPRPAPAPTHPSYDAMMALMGECNAAYGREMPAATTAHLVWRFLLEAYPPDALIADARARGRG